MADGTSATNQGNPDWTWDEQLLAFDVFLRHRAVGRTHPEVIALSALLRALPIHPADKRGPTFRNPNGVARKLADIQTHEPGYTGRPTKGSQLDTQVWEEYGHRRELAQQLAVRIRDGIGFAVPEDDEQVIEDMHSEGRVVYRMHRTRERDPRLREHKLEVTRKTLGRLMCEACRTDLGLVYGDVGDLVYECHHLIPLHVAGQTTTSLADVVLLCPTCHRVAHRMSPWPTRGALQTLRHGVA